MRFLFICIILLAIAMPVPSMAVRAIPKSKDQLTLSYAPLVKKAAPAVVNIYTKKKVKVSTFSLFGSDPIFKQFFGDESPFGGMTKERVENSLGSGIIVDPEGLVITNYHVIKGSEEITILLSDKREFEASVKLVDERTDLAVLKINSKNITFPYLKFSNSDTLEVGDLVLAIGNPFGVGQTVTSGIISALSRTTVGVSDYQFFIQTDAAINPGNSGGALITMDGLVAGINTAIFSRSGGSNGIGFATPANMASTILDSAKKGQEKVIRPWLGVTMQKVTQDIAHSLGLEKPAGALISKLHPAGTASRSGLQVGDIITHIEQYAIEDEHALRFRVGTYPIGKTVPVTLYRENKTITLSLKMEPAPEVPERDVRQLKGFTPLSGATIANISPAVSEELRLGYYDNGVVVININPKSLASRVGISIGDIIISLNGFDISSTSGLTNISQRIENDPTVTGWKIRILRDGRYINYTLRK